MQDQINQVRKDHAKLTKQTYDRTAVIVKTEGCKNLGVQFWTQADIEKGFGVNTDKSISRLVEIL
jgi:hypothetical protein